eukprot:jgi/Botrbrau1/3559/Bobra.0078s0016.1
MSPFVHLLRQLNLAPKKRDGWYAKGPEWVDQPIPARLKVEINRRQVEIKIVYHVDPRRNRQRYKVQVFIFMPADLEAVRTDWYQNFWEVIRLHTPKVPLASLSEMDGRLHGVMDSITALTRLRGNLSKKLQKEKRYAVQRGLELMRLQACMFRSSLRSAKTSIREALKAASTLTELQHLGGQICRLVEHTCAAIEAMELACRGGTASDKGEAVHVTPLRDGWRLIDEYMLLEAERTFLKLLRHVVQRQRRALPKQATHTHMDVAPSTVLSAPLPHRAAKGQVEATLPPSLPAAWPAGATARESPGPQHPTPGRFLGQVSGGAVPVPERPAQEPPVFLGSAPRLGRSPQVEPPQGTGPSCRPLGTPVFLEGPAALDSQPQGGVTKEGAEGSRLWELDETMHARVRQPTQLHKGRGQAKKVEVPMPIDGEDDEEADWRLSSKCERSWDTSTLPDWDALSVGQGGQATTASSPPGVFPHLEHVHMLAQAARDQLASGSLGIPAEVSPKTGLETAQKMSGREKTDHHASPTSLVLEPVRNVLFEAAKELEEAREMRGYSESVIRPDDPQCNEAYTHRVRGLKRNARLAISLLPRTRQPSNVLIDTVGMVVAGLAMGFAVFTVWLAQQYSNNQQWAPLYIMIVVVGYIAKDRIKEWGKRYLVPTARWFGFSFPDRVIQIVDQHGRKMGKCSEEVTVLDAPAVNQNVQHLRNANSILPAALQQAVKPERVVLYKKRVEVNWQRLDPHFRSSHGLSDIMRLDFRPYSRRMRASEESHLALDERGCTRTIKCRHVYHLNLIFCIQTEDSDEEAMQLERIRVIVDQDRLLRLEAVDSEMLAKESRGFGPRVDLGRTSEAIGKLAETIAAHSPFTRGKNEKAVEARLAGP